MKYLIRTVQVITALILLFLCIGMLVPEFKYETETLVKASPEASYQIFTDESLTAQWMTGLKSFENIKGEPLTEGSQWKVIFERDGETFEMIETVTKVIPDQQFSMVLEHEMMRNEVDIYFEPKGENTVIRSENLIQPNGLFWQSLLALMQSSMQQEAQSSYNKLAQLIEQKKEAQ